MSAKLKNQKKRPSARGDTILSVLISVVIIGSVISATYFTVNSSLRLGRQSQERERALNAVSNQVERIKALLDGPSKDLIFKDNTGPGLNNLNTPASGFGYKFCLVVSNSSNRNNLVMDIKVDNTVPDPLDPLNNRLDTACQDPDETGLPADSQARIEVRYQRHRIPQSWSCPLALDRPETGDDFTNLADCERAKKGDNHRFEVAVYWVPLGGGPGELDEVKAYYRSHPLILGL